ncbi:MAG TPA: hypothetical protein VKB22_05835 [Gemmatimonadales bacterium]|nr:hypothetical protein [Gemmatimonadales bacterium]
MSPSIFRWSVPVALVATVLSYHTDSLATPSSSAARLGVAFFEPPRSIGTPIDDLARAYTGFGLAARIEGRLRLDTDASLNAAARELIRRRLAQGS